MKIDEDDVEVKSEQCQSAIKTSLGGDMGDGQIVPRFVTIWVDFSGVKDGERLVPIDGCHRVAALRELIGEHGGETDHSGPSK
jgi:hypothetical protein